MFRSQYDGDVTIWSPQGRIHQVEYAMEAVKQGGACVGIKSKTAVVLATLKRADSKLASHQRKVFKVDNHIGIAIAGLTADARLLLKYMRNECLQSRFAYDSAKPVQRLIEQVADKCQKHTQESGRRPYGVGLLTAGVDQTGVHLFESCPSGNYYDYKAQGIGARCQSAKTYLEKHVDEFDSLDREQLISRALIALRETLQTKDEEGLTPENTTVCVVSVDAPFELFENEKIKPFLDNLEGGAGGRAGGASRDILADDSAAPTGAAAADDADIDQ